MAKTKKTRGKGKGAVSTKPNPAKKDADIAPKVSPATYLQQVQQEGRKVVWPTVAETRQTTIMVMIMVIITGIFFFAVDFLIGQVVPFVLSFGDVS